MKIEIAVFVVRPYGSPGRTLWNVNADKQHFRGTCCHHLPG